ncbi:hypothetical protein ACFLYF_01905 [Chloroflexota bacterium]
MTAKYSQRQGLILKIGITWLCIMLLGGFFIATRAASSPVAMSILPEVPKAGEPVVATFNLNNPFEEPLATDFQLYVNGNLLESGTVTIAPGTSVKHQYAYRNPLERGEQINFALKTSSSNGEIDRIVSLPAYPPQLMSSFVSFAAFSTSVMSTMISTEYFNDTFGNTSGINAGIIIAMALVALLIFLELTQAIVIKRGTATIGIYRAGYGTISAILFIIVIGMVFTKVAMILAT